MRTGRRKEEEMRFHEVSRLPQCEQRDVADLMTEIAAATSDVTSRSAAALAQVCRAVITGEGPIAAGRIHFSRTIDAADAALCARILVLAGHDGDPVSRAEADALFDIAAAGSERRDGGRFDDLLAKAVAHHIMSAGGHDAPPRDIALSPETALDAWVSPPAMDASMKAWLDMRLRELRPSSAAVRAITAILYETERSGPATEVPIAAVFDVAA
jgi:hypothetical protein